MKLFKKLVLALSMLLLLGMITSCGGGAGAGGGPSSASYSLSYDNTVFMTIGQEEYDEITSVFTAADYSQSGNTILLTQQGFNKILESSEDIDDPDAEVVAFAVCNYDGSLWTIPLSQDSIDYYEQILDTSDYEIKANGAIIILTAEGLATIFAGQP